MPHLKCQNINLPPLPYGAEIKLEGLLRSTTDESEILLISYVDLGIKKHSVLEIKHKNQEFIIKFIKSTRPANIKICKDILNVVLEFCTNCTHNIKETKKDKLAKNATLSLASIDEIRSAKHIEIGFGSGRHLLNLCQKNVSEIILGIEIHNPSLMQVNAKRTELELKNLLLCNIDARLVLDILDDESLKTLIMHFPVPWNNAPNRRVISKTMLENTLRVLEIGGIFHLRSDDIEYFNDARALIEGLGQESKSFEIEYFKNQKIEISSKYEDRWQKQNKDIYDLYLHKIAKYHRQNSQTDCDFSLKDCKIDKLKKGQKCIEDDYFISINEVFLGDKFNLASVVLGDKNMPQNNFLIQYLDGGTRFLFSFIKTEAFLRAHQKLKEFLKDAQ